MRSTVAVIIPAFNEEQSLPAVLSAIPRDRCPVVIVVDNASTDQTAVRARAAGAITVHEPRRGYGSAMLRGLAELERIRPDTDIVVFLDGDFSDDPARVGELVDPIERGEVDATLASRTLGPRDPGAMPWHSRLGNRLACWLIRRTTGARFTDLGPFRAIRRSVLDQLGMVDTNYGWTVEMQLKIARLGIPFREIPLPYRVRIGQSKISGTITGSLAAGYKILTTIARYRFARLPGIDASPIRRHQRAA